MAIERKSVEFCIGYECPKSVCNGLTKYSNFPNHALFLERLKIALSAT